MRKGVKEDYEIYMNGMRKKLESLQSSQVKTNAPTDGQKYHDYEEYLYPVFSRSKTMEDKLLLDGRKRSFLKTRPHTDAIPRATSERESKLLQFGLVLLIVLIVL
jgi:hypothetical protein